MLSLLLLLLLLSSLLLLLLLFSSLLFLLLLLSSLLLLAHYRGTGGNSLSGMSSSDRRLCNRDSWDALKRYFYILSF